MIPKLDKHGLQEVLGVTSYPDIPVSPISGPWSTHRLLAKAPVIHS